ncbi:MAG: HAD-IC family P-type ATPase, partial [Patescibacteria group bacterium]
MDIAAISTLSTQDTLKNLRVSEAGLNDKEVLSRQGQYGKNEVTGEKVYWWTILLRQFKSPFLYLLIGAGLLSLLLGERIDGALIFLFVSINAGLGFYQEYRSEQTLKLLKNFIQFQTKVVREGKNISVNSSEMVPGDIVMLEAGDIISADIRLIEESDFTVDESVLTGESVSVRKISTAQEHASKELFSSQNICFSGTTVATGKAKGVVVRTGKETALGEITKLTVETHRESSFEKGIARFSKFILYVILITLAGIFFINLFIKGSQDIPLLLIFSVALAVSVIPEGLPVVITFSLSRGALQLAKNKVVVKRLSAIEDLGSIEVLCTDKTGTLTENHLTLH